MIETSQTRRDLLLTCGTVLAGSLFPIHTSFALGTLNIAQGQVYEIVQGNRRGLSNVLVTNGIICVRTDKHGFYQLPIERNCVISLVKPSGYSVPIDPVTQLPKFYYVHLPDGTPSDLNFTYDGIKPTGEVPERLDFHLTRQLEDDCFKVILFGDPQPENDNEVNFIRDGVIPKLIQTDAKFGMTLGDIVGDDLSLYPRLTEIIGLIGIPWYQVCGNHDLNYEAVDNIHARDTFKRHFGPTHYAFEYANVLFIVLQNIVYHGYDSSQPDGQGTYHEEISLDQIEFAGSLIEQTDRDKLIVFLCHAPLKSKKNELGVDIAIEDTKALLTLVADRKSISFSGHTHRMEHKYISLPSHPHGENLHHHHVLTTLCGSWWSGPISPEGIAYADACDGSPNGYYELTLKGREYQTDFIPLSLPQKQKMRIMLAQMIEPDADSTASYQMKTNSILSSDLPNLYLIVNFFEGGPKTRISFEVDESAPVSLKKIWIKDPWLKQRYGDHKSEIKPWVTSANSSHVWIAQLPVDLKSGLHKITVHVSDEFGRAYHDHLCFEILPHHQARLIHKT